jgi:hypothetical protein
MVPTHGRYCYVTWRALIVLAVQLLSLPTLAQTPSPQTPSAQPPSITWSTDIVSQYINIDDDELLHATPVIQSSLNVKFENGIYLYLWGSKSLDMDSPVENFGNEIDYAVGWAGQTGPVGVDVSVYYWSLSDPLLLKSHGDVVQSVIEVNKEFTLGQQTFTPYVQFLPTFPFDGTSAGIYAAVGLKHSVDLTELLTFNQAGRIGYAAPGIYGLTSGYIFRYDAAFAWQVSKNSVLRLPTFRAFFPITSLSDGRTNEYIFGAGYDRTF